MQSAIALYALLWTVQERKRGERKCAARTTGALLTLTNCMLEIARAICRLTQNERNTATGNRASPLQDLFDPNEISACHP